MVLQHTSIVGLCVMIKALLNFVKTKVPALKLKVYLSIILTAKLKSADVTIRI